MLLQKILIKEVIPRALLARTRYLGGIYRVGFKGKTTGHGFRALASTILNEERFPADAIERQLSHGERNKVRASYNYAEYLPERRKMMQWWADRLGASGLLV